MFKNSLGQVRSGWIILFGFLCVLIIQTIFAAPGLILLGIVEGPDNLPSTSAAIMLLMDNYPWIFVLMQGGGTAGGILVTLLLWRYLNKKTLKELGFRGSLKDLAFGLLLGAISITLIFTILMMTGKVSLINSFSEPEFSIFAVTYLIIFILVGFFEEMFFRGYVMSTMANLENKKWLIYVVSALFFSIVHGSNPNVSIFGLINIALVGILFAYMFDVTNSLWLPIGYHITWNYFQGNVFGFAVSGIPPHGIYNLEIVAGNDLVTGGSFGLEGGLLATIMIILGFLATRIYAKSKNTLNQGMLKS